MVREREALSRPRADAVRVQPAHAQQAHHVRQPEAARRGVRGRGRELVRAEPRSTTPSTPADVHAVQAARARAAEPRRRLADVHVLGGRRHAERLPPRAPRGARRRRRRARDGGDDRRVARGPHLAGLRRDVPARARRRVEAHRRLRPRALGARRSGCSSGTPGRKALDQGDVGGQRSAARVGQLADHERVAAAVLTRTARSRARWTAATWTA